MLESSDPYLLKNQPHILHKESMNMEQFLDTDIHESEKASHEMKINIYKTQKVRSLSTIEKGLQKGYAERYASMLRRNIMVHKRQQEIISRGMQ